MSIWKALSTIRHNGVTTEAGQIVHDIDDATAAVLANDGIVVLHDGQHLASEIKQDVQHVASEAVADGEDLVSQAEQDIKESLAQNEQLKAAPAQPVTKGSPAQPTAEQIAADAASVE